MRIITSYYSCVSINKTRRIIPISICCIHIFHNMCESEKCTVGVNCQCMNRILHVTSHLITQLAAYMYTVTTVTMTRHFTVKAAVMHCPGVDPIAFYSRDSARLRSFFFLIAGCRRTNSR